MSDKSRDALRTKDKGLQFMRDKAQEREENFIGRLEKMGEEQARTDQARGKWQENDKQYKWARDWLGEKQKTRDETRLTLIIPALVALLVSGPVWGKLERR